MSGMREAAVPKRFAWAALVALLLALRSLGSVGYMPELEHGRFSLALCPDGEWSDASAPMAGMDRHHGATHDERQQCPYAAAAAIPFAAGSAPLLPLPSLALLLVGVFELPSIARKARVERPFATGPPIPA